MGKGFKHHNFKAKYPHTFKTSHVFIECPFCGRPFDRDKIDLAAIPTIKTKVKRLGGYRCIEWIQMSLDKASMGLLKSIFLEKAKQIIEIFSSPEREIETICGSPLIVETIRTSVNRPNYPSAPKRMVETPFGGVRS